MEAAKILGLSRIAVFQKIKAGKIRALQVGRSYVIRSRELMGALRKKSKDKK